MENSHSRSSKNKAKRVYGFRIPVMYTSYPQLVDLVQYGAATSADTGTVLTGPSARGSRVKTMPGKELCGASLWRNKVAAYVTATPSPRLLSAAFFLPSIVIQLEGFDFQYSQP
jgi:hypothetical protein